MTPGIFVLDRDQNDTVSVFVDVNGERTRLPLRLDLFNHSPSGFEFGFEGSGPAQLALAMLAHCVGDARAIRLHQKYKRARIAILPRTKDTRHEITVQSVVDWADSLSTDETGGEW